MVEKTRKPVILDDEGVQIMGTVGPYRLGQPLILVCVGEGDPAPDLVWLRNRRTFDTEMDPGVGRKDRQRNTMVVSSLAREHAGNTFTCQVDFYTFYTNFSFLNILLYTFLYLFL